MSISQGKKIRLIRESLNMGRGEFSDTTGIPKQTLIGYEMERTKPGGEALASIAKVWPEFAAYLLTDETHIKQRKPELDQTRLKSQE
ncbi:helix-turn-helix domain-containing protein [Methylovorus menthalis]|uniref:helix-turn-helix domain-containing protein n=1 Tax=Methylovorus menthalis TaxID=1002227 RepID=UPI001E5513AE|nr:helix-turn-helix transcriptional regulator [Methylovorus menthalis]MCB4809700.1 helix-turn-helix domain-containing protein [Methylovorus menthalis]